jgi:hypothetical protein
MNVRMDQLLCLDTGRANPAGVSGPGLLTDDILRKGKRKRQGAASLRAQEQKGMTQPVAVDQFHQMLFYRRLPDNGCERHSAKIEKEDGATRKNRTALFFPLMSGALRERRGKGLKRDPFFLVQIF